MLARIFHLKAHHTRVRREILAGRWRDLNPTLVVLSLLFVIKLAWFNA
jgi:xanthine/uracil/vitamin C permease (AzgA family)